MQLYRREWKSLKVCQLLMFARDIFFCFQSTSLVRSRTFTCMSIISSAEFIPLFLVLMTATLTMILRERCNHRNRVIVTKQVELYAILSVCSLFNQDFVLI